MMPTAHQIFFNFLPLPLPGFFEALYFFVLIFFLITVICAYHRSLLVTSERTAGSSGASEIT